jgi:hypothetical protein
MTLGTATRSASPERCLLCNPTRAPGFRLSRSLACTERLCEDAPLATAGTLASLGDCPGAGMPMCHSYALFPDNSPDKPVIVPYRLWGESRSLAVVRTTGIGWTREMCSDGNQGTIQQATCHFSQILDRMA